MHYPVDLPGGAAVRREALLPPRRGRDDLRPEEAYLDRPAVEGFIRQEGADAVLEAAPHRLIDRGIALIEPPDQPLSRLGVERADGDGAIGSGGQLNDIVVDVALAAERRPVDAGAGEFLPLGAAGKARFQPAMPDVPASDQEVPVMQIEGLGHVSLPGSDGGQI